MVAKPAVVLLLLFGFALSPVARGDTWNIFETRKENAGQAGSFAGTIVRGAGGGHELTIMGVFTPCPAGVDPYVPCSAIAPPPDCHSKLLPILVHPRHSLS
jgi:hypothetical protein